LAEAVRHKDKESCNTSDYAFHLIVPVILPVAWLYTPAPPIARLNPVGPALPAAFIAVTLMVLVPAVVGVPESSPRS
jgi:hypothetical protein